MAWLTDWSYRVPITCDMSSLSGSSTNDVDTIVPGTWDHFWSTIDASGYEIRVTTGDGTTAAAGYKWTGFHKTNKTGTINADNVAYAHAPSVVKLYLYYGNTGASDGSAVFTPSSAVLGYIETLTTGPALRVGMERPGALTPQTNVALTKTSIITVGMDFEGALRQRCQTSAGRFIGEEITEITATLNDTSDTGVANGTLPGKTRIHSCRRQIGQSITVYIDGTAADIADGSDYVLDVTVYTDTSRTINARVGVLCRDVRPR